MANRKNNNNQQLALILGVFVLLVLTFTGTMALIGNNNKSLLTDKKSIILADKIQIYDNSTNIDANQAEMLVYLIEEEKLAHDVYKYMYDKYGSQVFGNILKSEINHQDEILKLLQQRNISDPRTGVVGVFNNKELQELYNQLIKQGDISSNEAYKVGVIIEEKDIADIEKQLSTTKDQQIIDTLTSLKNASENHLRAFNRQINR
jgi:hypothetical protein